MSYTHKKPRCRELLSILIGSGKCTDLPFPACTWQSLYWQWWYSPACIRLETVGGPGSHTLPQCRGRTGQHWFHCKQNCSSSANIISTNIPLHSILVILQTYTKWPALSSVSTYLMCCWYTSSGTEYSYRNITGCDRGKVFTTFFHTRRINILHKSFIHYPFILNLFNIKH